MNICLYGASSNLIEATYITQVEALGAKMALKGHSLVYGGGAQGLMGAAARGVTANGGTVIGVSPSFFNVDGILFENCTEMIYTETMRERKEIMEIKADAFIVVPGGPGTLDEFFEIFTLKQVSRHNKPIAIFNINGYYDDLEKLLKSISDKNFMTAESLNLCKFFTDSDELLNYIENYTQDKIDIYKLKNI